MAVDKYANIATIQTTMSAANFLTFAEMRTGMGIESDRKTARAMIIDQIDYLISAATLAEITTGNDDVTFAICVSNAVTDISDITDRRILHSGSLSRRDLGTAATGIFFRSPLTHQFFPALITAERSLYLGADSTGLASAIVLQVRLYYRQVEITQADFIELAEVFRLVG